MSWSKWVGAEPIDADTYLARVQEEDAYHATRRAGRAAARCPAPDCRDGLVEVVDEEWGRLMPSIWTDCARCEGRGVIPPGGADDA